jgi:hypothetical protein
MSEWMNRVVKIALFIVLLQLPQLGYADREFEMWDTLPQMENVIFSKTSVGFISIDQRYFILDRVSRSFKQVKEHFFYQQFPDRDAKKIAEVIKKGEHPSTVILRASNGMEFKTENAYCAEGTVRHHKLWMHDRLIAEQVRPCVSISSVEIVGDQLWLGTRYDGEGGDYPARGIVIQSLQEGKLINKIDTRHGLTGNLVRVIRIDPYGKNVWVVTHQGFNEIDRVLKVVDKQYFCEDFIPTTGESAVLLSPVLKPSNPFAVISRVLAVQNAKGFYEAVKRIPETMQTKFSLYNFFMGMYSSYGWSKDKPFIPKEMNILIPFFLDVAKSGEGRSKWIAMNNLRMFHSERIIDFFLDLEKSDPEGKGPEERAIRNSLDKYAKFGLMTSDQTAQRITLYLERIQDALKRIRSSHPNTSSVGGRSIVGSVKSLKKMGNLQGIQLINDYFVASDGNPRDGHLYDTILAQLYTCDELTPAVLEGLKKIQTEHTYRGCGFFDMRYRRLHGSRYDERYAEAILIALERAMKRKGWLGDIAVKECTEAFKSQIRNTKVNEDFFSQIYPNLSSAQKDIADRLLLTISLPFDDTWRDGPDLTVESLFPPLIMAKGGSEIPIMDITVNGGDVSARPSVTQYYLSEDPAIDPVIDLLIGERAVPLLGPGESSDSGAKRFVLPAYLTEGLYFLGACADGSEAVKELNELNNCYINESGR